MNKRGNKIPSCFQKGKRGISLIIISLLLVSFILLVSAQEESPTVIEDVQQCIMDKVGEDCSTISQEEIPFAVLGLGDYENCSEALNSSSRVAQPGQQCWPSSNCKVKDTAIAILALYQLGEDTTAAENWLLNQTKVASDLEWYLQITPDEPALCTVAYGSVSANIEVREDETLSGDVTGCLSKDSSGYWLRISSDENCISQQYLTSCNKPFKTNLIYKTPTSPAIHVSQKTNFENADATTIEEVTYKCFKQNDKCNYESTLWAAIVLDFAGYSPSDYLPYLEAGLDENSALFPEVFLYRLDNEDYREYVISSFNGQYWGAGAERFYKTALAFMALTDGDAEVGQAKDYLLTETTPGSDGCWGNIRDSGFLLYTGWPGEIPNPPTPPNINGEPANCIDHGYFCKDYDICTEAGGQVYDNFACSGLKICCSTDAQEKTCSERSGIICPVGYECPAGSRIPSQETSQDSSNVCCAVECELATQKTECETEKGTCRLSCNENEQESYYNCEAGTDEICCTSRTAPPPPECSNTKKCNSGFKCESGKCVEKSSNWWIWILVILIILAILAIVFRSKIQMFIFKRKEGVKKGPAPKTTQPPTFPSRPAMPPPPRGLLARPGSPQPRPVFKQPARRPIPKSPAKDKDMEETLKKLKEMSK